MITKAAEPHTKTPDKKFKDYVMSEDSLNNKMVILVQHYLKPSPIRGCITGSYWLPGFDADTWGTKPDIDVFVYSKTALIEAISYVQHVIGLEPGTGDERSKKQEQWKLDRLKISGLNYKTGIITYKFNASGVIVNLIFKQKKYEGKWIPITTAPEVLMSFDMSIVMQAYDIQTDLYYDMRIGDPMIAVPNPCRYYDGMAWTVAKWIRQFDRVVKYYNRGFDTRPMAEFYLNLIDDCIEQGCLFESEESQNYFTQFTEEFKAKRENIALWLEEHKED